MSFISSLFSRSTPGRRSAQESRTVLVTGANSGHFANLTVLLGSWSVHMAKWPLVVCDFGFTQEERRLLERIDGVRVVSPREAITHPWQGKTLVGDCLAASGLPCEILVWIDADALFAHALPELGPLLEGYDVLIDAHVQSVGEIVHECNLAPLGLRRDDAYFSAGWWVARPGPFLKTYKELSARVQGRGNLWECDAFVASIYAHKLRLRTVNGGIWHCRGKTSLHTCQVEGLHPLHAGHPIYVVHANDGYEVRASDQRRVFRRPELAAVQDHYERIGRDLLRR